MQQLTAKEITLVTDKLKKIKTGAIPLPIFIQICRLCVLVTVEVLGIYLENNSTKVLLTKRDDNDPTWPGLLHIPGTVIRPSDNLGDYSDALNRVIKDEIRVFNIIKGPVLVKPVFRDLGRGKEVTLLYWVQLGSKPDGGNIFDVNKLPPNVVKKQIKYIKMIVDCFNKNN